MVGQPSKTSRLVRVIFFFFRKIQLCSPVIWSNSRVIHDSTIENAFTRRKLNQLPKSCVEVLSKYLVEEEKEGRCYGRSGLERANCALTGGGGRHHCHTGPPFWLISPPSVSPFGNNVTFKIPLTPANWAQGQGKHYPSSLQCHTQLY